jgi:hypothetical protein
VVDALIGPTSPALVAGVSGRRTGWTATAYDDAAWSHGTNAFGFDRSGAPPMTRPARYYPLETDFQDASGNGVHGLPQSSPEFEPDWPPITTDSSASLRFDGQGDSVTMPEPVVPTAYTLCLWVKFATIRSCSLVVLSRT